MGFLKKVKKVVKATTTGVGSSISTVASAVKDIGKDTPGAVNEGRKVVRDIVVAADTAALNYQTGGAFQALGGGQLLDAAAGSSVYDTPQQEQEGQPMGSFLGGLSGVLGQLGSSNSEYAPYAQIGSSFLSGYLPAQGPVVQSQPTYTYTGFPQAQPVMSAAPMIRGAASAVAGFAAPLLAKMSLAIGKNVTLRAAMIIVRRLGKYLSSPQAIGAAIGLSVSELSSLITAASLAGSHGRRMNVGNVKALRRAHRRIKSFHKLCGDNDTLRAPRRRRAAPKIINCK